MDECNNNKYSCICPPSRWVQFQFSHFPNFPPYKWVHLLRLHTYTCTQTYIHLVIVAFRCIVNILQYVIKIIVLIQICEIFKIKFSISLKLFNINLNKRSKSQRRHQKRLDRCVVLFLLIHWHTAIPNFLSFIF